MDAFGIFEGGGAKGIAHIGALKATEERQVRFLGVAGTSAGAIVAALVAAGYKADELFSPGSFPTGLFAVDFLKFLDESQWRNFIRLRTDLRNSFQGRRGPIALWWAATHFLRRNRSILAESYRNRGFFKTERFREWIEEALSNKLKATDPTRKPSGPEGTVAFSDLCTPLKIIAADITGRKVKEYSSSKTPTASVSHAVAASVSIPLFFSPKEIDGAQLVDGGIVSNFPAWAFDREHKDAPLLTPTFGFKLAFAPIGELGTDSLAKVESTPLDFIVGLYQTSVFGDTSLETRRVQNLHEIPLRVRIGPLDFSVDNQTKNDVFRDGKDSARDFFLNYVGPTDAAKVRRYLKAAHAQMCKTLRHNGHLRVNVIRPVDNDKLQVIYTHNMDDDCDDRLEFPIGSGACGVCWVRRANVVCDLEDAARTFEVKWRMNKYQQRLVRPSLKSLLCVPICDPSTLTSEGQIASNTTIVGILNFDSDDRITEQFGSPDAQKTASECADLVFTLLKN
jgi:NTE family protein